MATTIATLTQKTDGILEGVFATIRVNAPIAIIPNASKSSEEAPRLPRHPPQDRLRDRSGLEPHRPPDRRGIPLGEAGGPRDRRDLRQPRTGTRRRSEQEGDPVEQSGLTSQASGPEQSGPLSPFHRFAQHREQKRASSPLVLLLPCHTRGKPVCSDSQVCREHRAASRTSRPLQFSTAALKGTVRKSVPPLAASGGR